MKKIFLKIKDKMLLAMVTILGLGHYIYGSQSMVYGPPNLVREQPSLFDRTTFIQILFRLLGFVFIPILIIIGTIVFITKSKKSKTLKIIVAILAAILLFLVVYVFLSAI